MSYYNNRKAISTGVLSGDSVKANTVTTGLMSVRGNSAGCYVVSNASSVSNNYTEIAVATENNSMQIGLDPTESVREPVPPRGNVEVRLPAGRGRCDGGG